jgi:hypothetical protein
VIDVSLSKRERWWLREIGSGRGEITLEAVSLGPSWRFDNGELINKSLDFLGEILKGEDIGPGI